MLFLIFNHYEILSLISSKYSEYVLPSTVQGEPCKFNSGFSFMNVLKALPVSLFLIKINFKGSPVTFSVIPRATLFSLKYSSELIPNPTQREP